MKRILCLVLAISVCYLLSAQHKYTLDFTETGQTITGFGASDAWSSDFLMLMNDSSRNLAADWLFSKQFDAAGNPVGIGLSIWRHNLGAGSSEQGDSSYISDPFRRTECFLNPDGTYSWKKQAGAQWMIRAARQRDVDKLVMFSNSPPVSLTKNGKAWSGTCNETNLDPSKDSLFSDYIVRSLKYYEDQNIRFDYVSPVNEPEWGWCRQDGQEGCPYPDHQIADIARKLSRSLTQNNLNASVQIPESGLLVFANAGCRTRAGRQNHIRNFFRKSSGDYIGDEQKVAGMICAHSYFTEWPLWLMRHIRKKTARLTEKYGIEYWQSEYCVLRKTSEITGSGRDTGMKTALYVSRVIHHDLVYGNASAWCWWLGISTADFKDGLLYVNRDGQGLTDSKTLWVLGNYSRFIHPGAVRIVANGKRDSQFYVSAYRNSGTEDVVIVVINMKPEKQSLTIKNLPQGKISAWETSETSRLSAVPVVRNGEAVIISPECVTTFVIETQ